MRSSLPGIVFLLSLCIAPLSANDDKPAVSADFRLKVDLRDIAPENLAAAEMIAYQGRILEIFEGGDEMILIDPVARRVEVIHLDRKQIAHLSFDRLDAETASYKNRLQRTVDKLSKSNRRADKLSASKTRDLIEPPGDWSYDAKAHSLKRIGKTTEVEAEGVVDDDARRLELMRLALTYLIKLDTYRSSDKIPPFTQLQTINLLMNEHRLRPTEMSFLYRLNGPPVRYRWSYQMSPGLTPADVELWTKLDQFRKTATLMDFDAYDRPPRASTSAGR